MKRSQLLPILLGAAAGVLCAASVHRIVVQNESESARSSQSVDGVGRTVRQPSLRRELLSRFEQYVQHRSRHGMLLLQEVISAYLRTDAEECLNLLYSLNAQSLVEGHTLGSIDTQVDLDDFAGTLRTAKEVDGRTGDALIKSAFRRLIEADPQKAFDYLSSLPAFLCDDLATELATSWGARDGAKAVDAFFKTRNPWKNQLMGNVFPAWAQVDPEAAYQRMLTLVGPGSDRDQFIGGFFYGVAAANGPLAIQLAKAHPDLPPAAMDGFEYAFRAMSRNDPQAALKAVESLPTSNMRFLALQGIATQGFQKSPEAALEAVDQLPASQTMMNVIKNIMTSFPIRGQDPYAVVDQETDPYRHQAAISGVCQGTVMKKGVDGLAEIVQKGLATGDQGWLEAAGQTALLPQPSYPGVATKAPPDWKALPRDVTEALLNYAKQNWTPEKAAALQAKLQ